MEAYYNIHNLVGIKVVTERAEVIDSCQHFLRYFKTDKIPQSIDIEIKDFNKFSRPENSFNVHGGFLGFKNGVYNRKNSYAIKVERDKIEIFLKESNVCINTFVEYFLIKRGCTFIHGAGISFKNGGIIFPAPPNTGKTLLISQLRKKENVKFFGDDYVILRSDGTLYSYPMDFSIYSYHFDFFPELSKMAGSKRIKRAFYEKILVDIVKDLPIKYFIKRIARFIGYDFLYGGQFLKIPAQQLIPEEKMGSSVKLKASLFLNRYDGKDFKVEAIKPENLVNEATKILQNEWCETLPVFSALSTCGLIDFPAYLNGIKNIMVGSFGNAKLFRVSIPLDMGNKDRILKIEDFLNKEIF